jgi:hypothetical protein
VHSDLASRLIKCVTGEEYGDYDIVHNVGVGYAEPGYPKDARWVTGDWNDKTSYANGVRTLISDKPSRLASALEWCGVEIEWHDEWTECGECYRLVRTQANSYSWSPSYLWANECEIVCHECAKADVGHYVADYVNDADKAITWIGATELEAIGFTVWENPDGTDYYESGWHPGQDDKPSDILASIHRYNSELDVVFLIDSVGQFDIRFKAYVRPDDYGDYDGEN